MGAPSADGTKGLLYAPVGEALESNDDEASRGGKDSGRHGEPTIERLELAIHRETQRLKGLGQMTRVGETGAPQRKDKVLRRVESIRVSRDHDFARDASRPRQLTVVPQKLRQGALLDGG